jgi:hypothetical protein
MGTPSQMYGHAPSQPKAKIWPWVVAGIGLILLMASYGGYKLYVGIQKGRAVAETVVQQFHQRLDAEQYHEIINDASDAFRGAAKKEELESFLKKVHTNMGNVKSSKQGNIQLQAQLGIGTLIIVQYETEYDSGKAEENFTWLQNEKGASLYGYRISAPQMLK